jgi:hypothetical protein
MHRTAKRRVTLVAESLIVLLLLEWTLAMAAVEGAADSGPAYKIRMCILPFYTPAAGSPVDEDLAPLLESALSANGRLELIPPKIVYEVCRDIEQDPWLVKGLWEQGGDPQNAEAYFWLRNRWLQRARARFPADYYVSGRVIWTGTRQTVVVDVTEPGPRHEAVFSTAREAVTAEALPEALGQVAADIGGFLEPRWVRGYLEEVRKRYLAQLWSLDAALKETKRHADAHPGILSLRLFLLSLYEEDPQTYGARARQTATEVVRDWDAGDEEIRHYVQKLGVDPFLVLCREQARQGDWASVLETCQLGLEKYPLGAPEYRRWQDRAQEELAADRARGTNGNAPSEN